MNRYNFNNLCMKAPDKNQHTHNFLRINFSCPLEENHLLPLRHEYTNIVHLPEKVENGTLRSLIILEKSYYIYEV